MAQKNIQYDAAGDVIKHDNPLDVGGVQVSEMQELLTEMRDLLIINNELLKGILQ